MVNLTNQARPKSINLDYDCRCQMNKIPICLAYGKEDPWVLPIFGMQVKRQMPDAPYYEISPAGHCPHDEVPEVNFLLIMNWNDLYCNSKIGNRQH